MKLDTSAWIRIIISSILVATLLFFKGIILQWPLVRVPIIVGLVIPTMLNKGESINNSSVVGIFMGFLSAILFSIYFVVMFIILSIIFIVYSIDWCISIILYRKNKNNVNQKICN